LSLRGPGRRAKILLKRESLERDGGPALAVRLFQVIFLGSLAQPAPLPIPARVIGTDKLQKVLDITHFHCPAVPLIDSIVPQNLSGLIRWKDSFSFSFSIPKGADPEYAKYVMRFYQLYEKVRKARPEAKVKRVDYYILNAKKKEPGG